jgi:hypothetical protein
MILLITRATPRALSVAAALAVVLGSVPTADAASPEDRAAAGQHLKQAQELRKQGQLAEACGHLQEVERLDPKLTTLMDLADCTEQLGKLVEAQALWAAARDRARQTEKPQSRARAEERLAAVERRIAHLTLELKGEADGIEVLRDDAPVDTASLGSAQPINPGDHVVVVKLAGHDDAKFDVKLGEGESQSLAIAPGPAIVVAAPPPPPPVAPPPKPVEVSTSSGSGQRTIGLVLGVTGLVAAGVGGALWFTGYRDSGGFGAPADQQVLAGQVSVIGGGALLLTGAVLFATAPSGKASTRARLPLAPTIALGPHGTLLGAAGAF